MGVDHMKWIILIGDDKLTLDSIKTIQHSGSLNSYDIPEMGERFCVEYGDDHIFYDYDDIVSNDYEKAELEKIPFSTPHFIMMVYQSEERMKNILKQDNFLKGIYIDDDHGHIMPIEEFIKL
jgi:hypothetical protein